ncbi:MAG: hypothetical protein A3K19_06190 [Lentisphaerae bacterium RIFOXYB12_FULL_65_16]|nr:MAG: hypothetical protein A3K19_06190 [Lentisphaerae bacterium RIFOXYB12_FULL_65_16]
MTSSHILGQPMQETQTERLDYIIEKSIARGAESVLYRARNSDCTGVYCVKAIRNGLGKMLGPKDDKLEHREKLDDVAYKSKVRHLKNEYAVGRLMEHSGRIPLVRMFGLQRVRQLGLEVGYDLIMELVDGDDMGNKKLREEADVPTKLNYFYQTAQALHFMHRKGYVHLDMKPSNIMLTNGYVKLIDFGVSTPVGHKPHGLTGTNGYFSPEQIISEPVDEGTDAFALGVTFAVVFGGKHLPQFRAQLVEKAARTEAKFHIAKTELPMVKEVPEAEFIPELRDLIMRLTIPKRDVRLRDMKVLINGIRGIAKQFDMPLTEPYEFV